MVDPVESLRAIHTRRWKSRQPVSSATRLAIEITREWQRDVTRANRYYKAEFPVHELGEKIDIVDLKRKIAYELKVSPNNTHMEFYRDVFKVLAHNQAARSGERLKQLIFLTPEKGAVRLQRGLGKVACRISKKFGFSVAVKAI